MIKEVLLVVTIIMPGNAPDVRYPITVMTMAECWDQAKEFAGRELTEEMRDHGVIGYGASCMWREKPSTKD